MNQLPAASSLRRTVVLGHTFSVGSGGTGNVVPQERTNGRFKRDFNSQLSGAPNVGVVCPQGAYLKLTFWEKF
jgi:hypothetical protein